ncbi:MAG TPA: helix-turn-helix domain-containing protein [Acidisphaera sp.]|nr:helix-turn-helix domain-containing protein [Acidisphaera sp.]HME23623.1 helix-turn-helix domain-containing protein [Acetobacteraceae bacterium]
MTGESFSIGELARATSTKVETIRYYERVGLLPPPARTGGNYRAYVQPHLERLSFIRRGRGLGFSLDEVRELLRLSDDRERPCAEVDRIARAHLAEVECKLADLTRLRGELRQLIEQCQHGTIADCRIIEALAPPGLNQVSAAVVSRKRMRSGRAAGR